MKSATFIFSFSHSSTYFYTNQQWGHFRCFFTITSTWSLRIHCVYEVNVLSSSYDAIPSSFSFNSTSTTHAKWAHWIPISSAASLFLPYLAVHYKSPLHLHGFCELHPHLSVLSAVHIPSLYECVDMSVRVCVFLYSSACMCRYVTLAPVPAVYCISTYVFVCVYPCVSLCSCLSLSFCACAPQRGKAPWSAPNLMWNFPLQVIALYNNKLTLIWRMKKQHLLII